MGEINKIESHIDFFYKTFRNILIIGISLVIISTIVLSLPHSSATNSGSGTDNLTITISSACTLSSVVDSEHSTNTNVGTYTSDIGKTTITTLCNDGNGYSVYAVGYSNNEEGNNKLINSERPEYSIDTGLNTSGLTSAWAMKLNNIENDPSPTPPVIETTYNDTYGIVPNDWVKVAGRTAGTTDMDEGRLLLLLPMQCMLLLISMQEVMWGKLNIYLHIHPLNQPIISCKMWQLGKILNFKIMVIVCKL